MRPRQPPQRGSERLRVTPRSGGRDRHPFIHMPAGFAKMTKGIGSWGWSTVPQKHMRDRVLWYTQAKIIGGGSSINAQIYTRGNPGDYDRWVEAGCEGWGRLQRDEDHRGRRSGPLRRDEHADVADLRGGPSHLPDRRRLHGVFAHRTVGRHSERVIDRLGALRPEPVLRSTCPRRSRASRRLPRGVREGSVAYGGQSLRGKHLPRGNARMDREPVRKVPGGGSATKGVAGSTADPTRRTFRTGSKRWMGLSACRAGVGAATLKSASRCRSGRTA